MLLLLLLVVVPLVLVLVLLILVMALLVLVMVRLVLVLVWLVLVLVRLVLVLDWLILVLVPVLVLVLVSGRDLGLVLRPVTLLVAVLGSQVTGLLGAVLVSQVTVLLLRNVALVLLSRLGPRSRLLNGLVDFWDFRFLHDVLLLHAFPAFLVEDGDCPILFAHGRGHHALLVARDVVGRPLAAAPGVETVLKTSAAGEADMAGDAAAVTFALILLVVTCQTPT